jgi:hypothetical protein
MGRERLGRRDFLRFTLLAVVGNDLGSCIKNESKPTPNPTAGLPTNAPQPTETVTSTSVPTLTPKPTEAPSPTPTKEIVRVPEIEGLREEREGERIVLRAEAGDPYGLVENEWAGEFRENVTMAVQDDEGKVESKKTGGLVLNSLIAEKILWSEIAKIPNQEDKWLVALPGDITALESGKEIKIETEISKGSSKGWMVKVSFDGVVPMVDIVPYAHKVIVLSSSYYGIAYMDQSVRSFSPCDQKICEGKEMYYLAAGGPLIDCLLNSTVESKFGNQIARARGTFLVSVSAGKESRNITAKKILAIEGVPVFVAAK